MRYEAAKTKVLELAEYSLFEIAEQMVELEDKNEGFKDKIEQLETEIQDLKDQL